MNNLGDLFNLNKYIHKYIFNQFFFIIENIGYCI